MWDPWADTRAAEDLRGRLQWFLLGRVAVLSFFLAVVASLYLGFGQEGYVVSVQRLLLAVAATYAFTLISALLLRRITRLRSFAHLQVLFDVLLITGVVFLTGGATSPFVFLYALPIVNSAGLLFEQGALMSAVSASLAYDLLVLSLASGILPGFDDALPSQGLDLQDGLRLATTNLTFILIAGLASVLTRRIHRVEQLLAERQAERNYLALLQETLARTIASGLVTTDADGRITSADGAAERLAGKPATALRGSDIGVAFPQLQLSATARLRFMQSAAPLAPIEFTHNNGTAVEIRCVAAQLKDTYGHPFGALYILQDVTRLKELERQLPVSALEEVCQDELEAATEMAEVADGLYGASSAIRRLRQLIERVADADATVLIAGESGTGKELVARAIHARSNRRDRAFVAVNCGAIPENLIESELFGHVRGAFTGAVADRAGCFRMADGGSLFLDEIGELPLHLQVKLLRVLQERVFRPVGGENNVAVNVRILAASNRDLAHEVKAGRFREDLYYRLNVITVTLPALRERREDIALLIRHFLRQFSDLHGRRVVRFNVAAARRLLQYEYPGNIRELENIVEHAVTLCDGETASDEHLPSYLLDQERLPRPHAIVASEAPAPRATVSVGNEPMDLDRNLAEYEKAVILRALSQAGGVKKRAAELLGINYRSFRHRLQKYGLAEPGDIAAADR